MVARDPFIELKSEERTDSRCAFLDAATTEYSAESHITVLDDPPEALVKGARDWRAWVSSHRWTTACIAVVVICALGAAVAGPICATGGCTSSASQGKAHSAAPTSGSASTAPRVYLSLIVKFSDTQQDALSTLPLALQRVVQRQHLGSSDLQILSFTSLADLEQARAILQDDTEVDLLLTDFGMQNLLPQQTGNDAQLAAILKQLSSGSPAAAGAAPQPATAAGNVGTPSGRRLHQDLLGEPITPNDPLYSQQWFHRAIQTPQAWAESTGAPYIIVAVIDTGTDLNHPDLKNNLWRNTNEIPGNGIDDDGNGYVDDYYGYDFAGGCLNNAMNPQGFCIQCTGQPNPAPFTARVNAPHGTHVAGLIAAVQDNEIGVTGVAPKVLIMSLKVDNCVESNGFSTASILQAYDYAFRMGAHIVSCSFGPIITPYAWPSGPVNVPGLSSYDPNQAMYQRAYVDAITPLSNKGVLVVAAAGNEFMDMDHYTQMGYFYGPCNTPLPNVLCVGASDSLDHMLPFSNYGNHTIDIAAPGQAVFSTWLTATGQSYGTYEGTSQATPIVSGVAALVLASLASVDGVLLRAEQLKSILLSSGDAVKGLAAKTVSGRRVNAASALQATVQINAQAGLSIVYPIPFSASGASILSTGLLMTYYSVPTAGNFTADEGVVDASVQGGPTSFPAFKYGAGYMLHISAMLYLASAGVYSMQLSTNLSSYSLVVDDTAFIVSGGTAEFVASAQGYYTFDLYIDEPISALNLTWRVPDSAEYVVLDVFYISTPTVAQVPPYAQNLSLSSGFQVFYNASMSPPAAGALRSLSASTVFSATCAVGDLAFTDAGAFEAALFPGGTAANAAVGMATTMLAPANYSAVGPLAFQVSCMGCSLTLNDLLLIDNWDSTQLGAKSTKASGCVTLVDWQTYNLTVLFATRDLYAAPMALTWGPCGGGGGVGGDAGNSSSSSSSGSSGSSSGFASLANSTTTSMLWQVADDGAGAIGGVQCDVWFNRTLGGAGGAFSPTWKVRLPRSTALDLTLSDSTHGPFSFALNTILPGLATSYPSSRGAPFSVRCWTYWRGLPGVAKLMAPVTGALQSAIYLSGRQVGGSGNGSALLASPLTTLLAGNLQLLAVEWTGATSTQTLSLMLSRGGSAAALVVDLSHMTLPLQIVPSLSGLVGNPGHYSVAYAPSSSDIAGLLQYDMRATAAVGNVSTDDYGLNLNATYPDAAALRTRYARADGFFELSVSYDANFTLLVSDVAGQSSSLHFGNVTVKNGAPFSGAATPAATHRFQLFLPVHPALLDSDLYYAPATMIVKSASQDASANFNVQVVLPTDDAGPMDQTVWARTSQAPPSSSV